MPWRLPRRLVTARETGLEPEPEGAKVPAHLDSRPPVPRPASAPAAAGGTFFDPRLNDPKQFPVAVRSGLWNKRSNPDLVTPKLAALHYYQLSIPAPVPDPDSFDKDGARRGKLIFEGKAQCSTCHVPPLFVEPGWPMHTAEELGIDDFQASRSPDGHYRTTPLKGLFVRAKGGFYHDGRFADYGAVVDHYNQHRRLGLTSGERADLIEYLKSL